MSSHHADAWRIDTLCCGVLRKVPDDALRYPSSAKHVDVPVLAWLLRNGDECILVDTGPASPESAWARQRVELDQSEGRSLIAQLKARNLAIDQIDAVISTHLHWDHCGAYEIVAAPIYVQRGEVRFAFAPIPTQLRSYEALELDMQPAWLSSVGRMYMLDGRFEIRPGVTAIPLPGHTPGSQGVLVQTKSGQYCITGDLVNCMENVHGQMHGWPSHIRGIPSGIHTDIEAWYQSLNLIQGMGLQIIASHDWAVLERGVFE
jgi:N-acyl homoserine lactone hydrolase